MIVLTNRAESWLKLGCFVVVSSIFFSTNAIAQFDKNAVRMRLYKEELLKESVVRNVGLKLGYKYWVESGYVLNGDFSSDIFSNIGTFLPAFDQYSQITNRRFKTLINSDSDTIILYGYEWQDLGTLERKFEVNLSPSWRWKQDLPNIKLYEKGVIGVYAKSQKIVFLGGMAAQQYLAISLIRNASSEDEKLELLKCLFWNYDVQNVTVTRSDSEIVGQFYSGIKQKNVEFTLHKYTVTTSEDLKEDPYNAIARLQDQLKEPRIGGVNPSAEAITQSIGRNRVLYAWSMKVEQDMCKAWLDLPMNRQDILKFIPAYMQEFDIQLKRADSVKQMKGMIAYSFWGCPMALRRLSPKMLLEADEAVIRYGLDYSAWNSDCHNGYCYVDTATGKILYASGELFTHDLRSLYFSDSNEVDGMRQYLKDRLFALPGEEQVEYDSAQSVFRVIRLGEDWWDMTINRHELYSLDYNSLCALLEENTCRLRIAGVVLEEE